MERLIQQIFMTIGRTWNIGGTDSVPSEEDILTVLDHAAESLFEEPELSVYTRGGLKVEKNQTGTYDVYVYVGEYI